MVEEAARAPEEETLLVEVERLESVVDRLHEILVFESPKGRGESVSHPIAAARDRIGHQRARLAAIGNYLVQKKERLHAQFGENLL